MELTVIAAANYRKLHGLGVTIRKTCLAVHEPPMAAYGAR
jgi:hypothetical protein